MKYRSTRGGTREFTASEAIVRGLAPDGGLFVPCELPSLSSDALRSLMLLSYPERAARVMQLFLDEFSPDELENFCREAYGEARFGGAPAPTVERGGLYLELWHGPTCAFKDMALQMLPRLLSASLEKCGGSKGALILTATSGDTGKAALEGFRDVKNTKIMVFYPLGGVSEIQKLQMTTQLGENVRVMAVRGNFDDAQSGVKRVLSDAALSRAALRHGWRFSSANSINWGRLLPQIAYYVSAYLDCAASGAVKFGDELDVCVPTGNFGNILAAYYAKKMGVPVGRLVCASNANNVLTDFIRTGVYDRRRDFHMTVSPSMDILVSSNLERLLYEVSRDAALVASLMSRLMDEGFYAVPDTIREEIGRLFFSGFCRDDETLDTIRDVWREHGYLIDPHTAVAEHVRREYLTSEGRVRTTLVVSTASPYKFCGAVLEALGNDAPDGAGVELIGRLRDVTGVTPPPQLEALGNMPERFREVCLPSEMAAKVMEFAEGR